ncbi:hypothetical protein N7489_001773 [Penicillium chrysogenum]|uniref:Uncharacterized protein n=1 Tax=Penicillium chrysogenum TaxID=5076 RepID=A0ABQ8WJM3_PENCH|nr:uncharacterized protein N7489_001773 [Penicillium chrysogenum]XP_061068733.1 uncharacterized protein N7525_008122 [Penicillium rubens]KAJ5251363.1 hypothetical protein N7489_001773 [Penicillium chrysogenum]KAJ5262796.1 hypothetical protein N7524_008101 [Penicillium chrysogenum]KAJ5270262.1 hypothetical protein N7505_006020 [Penicillium chrysogenum]KAJ5829869.1 hypothetical protein N7525_008122 [Penicillium rubens]KAJ5853455.1 hypothetical protein N7534_005998 [Penicillium rubens]
MCGVVSDNAIEINEAGHYNGLDGGLVSGHDATILEGLGGQFIKGLKAGSEGASSDSTTPLTSSSVMNYSSLVYARR